MGIFSKDYESAGVGIAKSAPKKKGLKLFWEIFSRKFWKIIEVNMIYSIFFIPLILAYICLFSGAFSAKIAIISSLVFVLIFSILFGPATAGMTKILRNYTLEKHAFILSDFFKAFKKNFKLSAIVGFLDVLAITSITLGLFIYPGIAESTGNSFVYVFLAISFSIGLTILMMNFYIFPMIIATDLSFKNIIKNSFALTCIALKKNLLTLLISLALYAIVIVPILFYNVLTLIFLLPFFPAALVCLISCFNCYPVIQKYVINPYYASRGEVNPELSEGLYLDEDNENDGTIFEDKGGSEKPIEKRKKGQGKRIS